MDNTIDMGRVFGIVEDLSDELYDMTKKAANTYFDNGNIELLSIVVIKTGLQPREILWLWL